MAHKERHPASPWTDEYYEEPLTPDQELFEYIFSFAPSIFGRIGEGVEVGCISVSGVSMSGPLTFFAVIKFPDPWPDRPLVLVGRLKERLRFRRFPEGS